MMNVSYERSNMAPEDSRAEMRTSRRLDLTRYWSCFAWCIPKRPNYIIIDTAKVLDLVVARD